MHVLEYLWSDEIPKHEGQQEQQHLHSITCHLGIFLAINIKVVNKIKVVEVNRIVSGQGDHGGISHNGFKA